VRVAALAGLIGLVALVIVALTAWRSPPFYQSDGDVDARPLLAPVMSDADYDAVHNTFPRPFVVAIERAPGAVLLYGATHTRDPEHPEIADIRKRWESFRATVALVEGRLGFLLPGFMDPVKHLGEMGAVNALARRDGVKVYSWELPREREIALMLRSFPAERVALFYVLRPYFGQYRFGRPEKPDRFVEEHRAKRTQWPGLEGTLPSIAAIDAVWQRDFAGHPDWRDTSDEYGLPGYLGDLSSRSNAIRNEHLAHVILDLAGEGERVFAIAGSSHAVRLENTLRAEPVAPVTPAEGVSRSLPR
jgi:hypothetical protein